MLLGENCRERAPFLAEAALPVQPAGEMRAAKIHAIMISMDINTTLRITYVVLVISLASLAGVIGSLIFHFEIPAALYKPMVVMGYVWPAAAYAIAILRKRREQN